jgi:hypothetical protein
MLICRGTKQRPTSREQERSYCTKGLYMYASMYAGVLSQLVRYSVGLVLVASVRRGRLTP